MSKMTKDKTQKQFWQQIMVSLMHFKPEFWVKKIRIRTLEFEVDELHRDFWRHSFQTEAFNLWQNLAEMCKVPLIMLKAQLESCGSR